MEHTVEGNAHTEQQTAHQAPAEERLPEFKAEELVNNIASAAIFYSAKGFDAFDEVLLVSDKFEKAKIHELLEGSIHTYSRVLSKMQDQMTVFQREALESMLAVPTPPLTEAAMGTTEYADEAQEAQCDAELADLTQQIVQVRLAMRKAKAETALLRREHDSFGNTKSLTSVTAPIASGKENLSQDVEAILMQAKKLEPLLERAEQVMLEHQELKGALTLQTGSPVSAESSNAFCAVAYDRIQA